MGYLLYAAFKLCHFFCIIGWGIEESVSHSHIVGTDVLVCPRNRFLSTDEGFCPYSSVII
ncbi:hypothetical protein HMPREF9303_0180 [Prevotella denticola CRIS 18C-A]|uniref:Uncharacterized protein n=1 Tax=Prevotella denticola CRIS 18C-A TaxID=944557 RepID=F0HAR6_9BACT|nr:hypothetical protein HMPREF9303_0180 [Prevotella denticola CRIS 18C-A]